MKKLDPKSYPYLAASIQAVQYGHVGFVYLSWVGMATAGLLGVLMSFGMALASSKINDIAKVRRPSSWVAFLLLAIVSPAFVGVGMWIALDVIPSPFWRVVVAALWGLIPDGSVALVGFITGKGLVISEEKMAEKDEKPLRKKKKVARKPLKDADLLSYFQGNPGTSDTQAAEHFGVSRQAIGQRRKKLYSVGAER
jgi:hypothetical protein